MKSAMCASKLSSLGSSLRLCFSRPLSISSRPPFVRLPSVFAGFRILFSRFYVQSSDLDGVVAEERDSLPAESWPEWKQFLEKLKSKGYFNDVSSEQVEKKVYGKEDAETYLNRVKIACLSFARHRFNILGSLSEEDIKVVVAFGCPNILHKTVNSAKRLRAFLRLDEGDVCSSCTLRNYCDRAYVIPKDDEIARSVDVMRVLFNFVVNPDPQLQMNGKATMEETVRKLLFNLTELCDTYLDPTFAKPAERSIVSKKLSADPVRVQQSRNTEMKRGDWLCPSCNFLNFARNLRCLMCKNAGPRREDFEGIMKLGDWICSECGFMNFARNRTCFRCRSQRPPRNLNPGEWECPSCYYLNFGRNTTCLKCKSEPLEGADAQKHVNFRG